MKKLVSILVVTLLLAVTVMPFALSASAEEAPFWVSHFNDVTVEGSGVIITDESNNTNQAWRINVSFAPVEGEEGVYEIVYIYNYLQSGADSVTDMAPVPEGGFVYQLNYGNDYPSLNMDGPDYTSPACNDMITDALTWAVGDKFTFTNLDLEGLTVSTTTPDVNWYDDAYVCTTTYTKVIDDSQLPAESDPVDESAPADDSKPADESTPADTSVPADTSAEAPAEGGNTVLWVVLGVVAAIVVVAVIVMVSKKKK